MLTNDSEELVSLFCDIYPRGMVGVSKEEAARFTEVAFKCAKEKHTDDLWKAAFEANKTVKNFKMHLVCNMYREAHETH